MNLYKNIGKVVLDGSENWIFNEVGIDYIRYTLFIDDLVLTTTSDANKYYAISNNFVSSTSNQTVNDKADANRICVVSNKRLLVKTLDITLSNVNLFKTWLSTHNTEVYYVLATPYEVDLGIVDITLFNGINHINNSEDADMSITYVKDINIVINKLTNAVVSLGGNV